MRPIQPLTEMSVPWNFLGGKVPPARRADNTAVLVVPNANGQMEAEHSSPLLSLHDLLRESFALLVTAVYTTHLCSSLPDNIASHFNQLHISQ